MKKILLHVTAAKPEAWPEASWLLLSLDLVAIQQMRDLATANKALAEEGDGGETRSKFSPTIDALPTAKLEWLVAGGTEPLGDKLGSLLDDMDCAVVPDGFCKNDKEPVNTELNLIEVTSDGAIRFHATAHDSDDKMWAGVMRMNELLL